MILYKFNQDGIYSSVEKHDIPNDLAIELLSESSPEYFKSFSKAKSELKKYLLQRLEEIKYALQDCNALKKEEVNDYTN